MLRLSRAQLYEMVWSKPMTEIARERDVRDLRVAQICDRYDIARPPAGYWQKLAHGKHVQKDSLVNDTFSADQIVTIEGKVKMPRRAVRPVDSAMILI
jgi:hypothetical protein